MTHKKMWGTGNSPSHYGLGAPVRVLSCRRECACVPMGHSDQSQASQRFGGFLQSPVPAQLVQGSEERCLLWREVF